MAKILDSFPSRSSISRGRYPWGEWFDGKPRELHQGTEAEVEAGESDYSITTKSFRSAITQAKKAMNGRGIPGHAKTQVIKTGKEETGVVLQWVNDGSDEGDEQ